MRLYEGSVSNVVEFAPLHGRSRAMEADVVTEARDRLQLVIEVEHEARERKRQERYFDGVDPWNPEEREARQRTINPMTGERQTPKPTLSFDIADTIIQQQLAQARLAKFMIELQSRTALRASESTRFFNGLVKQIQRESSAVQARMWGHENALKFGDGVLRIDTDYADQTVADMVRAGDIEGLRARVAQLGPEAFDQILVPRRVLDQETVYWDPYAEECDKRDADWAIQAFWISVEEHRRKWPGKEIMFSDFGAEQRADDPWFALSTNSERDRAVRMGHYYRVSRDPHRIVFFNGACQLYEDVDDDVKRLADDDKIPTRVLEQRSIEIFLMNGHEVLERRIWPGSMIPLVPFVGKEYVVDGKYSTKGIIHKLQDVIRIINVTASSAAEQAARTPRTPYVVAAGQDEGFEDEWDEINTSPASRVHYNAVSLDGRPVPPPAQQTLDPQTQGLMMMVQQYRDLASQITGSVDPSTRASYPYDRSGRAVEALQREGNSGNAVFLDNLANVSMMREAMIYVDAAPHVYDRPGRMLYIQGGDSDGEERPIIIKQPFVYDESGMPMPVPCPQCSGRGAIVLDVVMMPCPVCEGSGVAPREFAPPTLGDQKVHWFDPSEGRFHVSIAIGRMHETAQRETLTHLTEIAKAVGPEAVPMFIDKFFDALPGPGMHDVAARFRRANPELMNPEDQSPEKLAAENKSLREQSEQMAGVLEEYERVISSKQVEQAGKKEIEALRARAQLTLEAVRQSGARGQLRVKGGQAVSLLRLSGQMDRLMQLLDHQHDVRLERVEQGGRMELQSEKDAGDRALERTRQAAPEPAPAS